MAGEKKCLGLQAAIVLSALSCGPSKVVTNVSPDHARLKAIVTFYAYACRDLQRTPESLDDLLPIMQQAKVSNPSEYFTSTRDGQPYVIVWGLDLQSRYQGARVPIAYERAGTDGKRLLVMGDQTIEEITHAEFERIEWPKGYEPELPH